MAGMINTQWLAKPAGRSELPDVVAHQRRASEAFMQLHRLRIATPRDRASPDYARALADAEAAFAAAEEAYSIARRGYLAGTR